MILSKDRVKDCRDHLTALTEKLRDGGSCLRMVKDLCDSAEYLSNLRGTEIHAQRIKQLESQRAKIDAEIELLSAPFKTLENDPNSLNRARV